MKFHGRAKPLFTVYTNCGGAIVPTYIYNDRKELYQKLKGTKLAPLPNTDYFLNILCDMVFNDREPYYIYKITEHGYEYFTWFNSKEKALKWVEEHPNYIATKPVCKKKKDSFSIDTTTKFTVLKEHYGFLQMDKENKTIKVTFEKI